MSTSISINEVENGMGLLINGEVWTILEFNHVKPGKGSAFVRVRIRNLKTDAVLERTYRSAETLEKIELEERKMQFLYSSGDDYYFMDQSTYEEQVVKGSMLGDGVHYLQDNLQLFGYVYDHQILKMQLPNFIIATITETEPGIKGDSSKSGYKPARIETGATIQVPLFIDVGETIKVDTRTGIYVERVKK